MYILLFLYLVPNNLNKVTRIKNTEKVFFIYSNITSVNSNNIQCRLMAKILHTLEIAGHNFFLYQYSHFLWILNCKRALLYLENPDS